MLTSLCIQNILFIDDAIIKFHPKFNAIFGETGSGKSAILDCINFAIGGKTDRRIVSNSTEPSKVTLTMVDENNSILRDLSLEASDKIIIMRSLDALGNDTISVNGSMMTHANVFKVIGSKIAICGQLVQTKLYNQSEHCHILDSYIGLDDALVDMQKHFNEYKKYHKMLKAAQTIRDRDMQNIIFYKQIVKDIDDLQLMQDEESELIKARQQLLVQSKSSNIINEAITTFEKGGIMDRITSLSDALIRMYRIKPTPQIEQLMSLSSQASSNLMEVSATLNEIMTNINDEANIELLDDRIHAIREISRKYNVPSQNLLKFCDENVKKLEQLENLTSNIEQIEKNMDLALSEANKTAKLISDLRLEYANKLQTLIQKEMSSVGIDGATFQINIMPNKLSSTGFDAVQFMASMNPNIAIAPLNTIASGGELSRLMLVMQSIIANNKLIQTIVFDEIDGGISGKTANMIGQKIVKLSDAIQVIAVTHSIHVISFAHHHIDVSKSIHNSKAVIKIESIDNQKLINTLAKMIAAPEDQDKNIVTDAVMALLKANSPIQH